MSKNVIHETFHEGREKPLKGVIIVIQVIYWLEIVIVILKTFHEGREKPLKGVPDNQEGRRREEELLPCHRLLLIEKVKISTTKWSQREGTSPLPMAPFH